MSQIAPPVAYSPQAAAEALQVSRQTIYNMMEDGRLTSFKIGRCRRIPTDAIYALMGEAVDHAR